jgi:hypothetical protein
MPQERRRHPRIQEPVKFQYQSERDAAFRWLPATMINISAGGLRFRCMEDPPEERTGISLRVPVPDSQAPALLNAHVMWRQLQASGVMEAGAEFISLGFERRRLIERLVAVLSAASSKPDAR